MSHVTFHLSIAQTATDIPLLTPPLFRVDWFKIKKKKKTKKKLINHEQKTLLNLSYRLYHFNVLPDADSLKPYIPTQLHEER